MKPIKLTLLIVLAVCAGASATSTQVVPSSRSQSFEAWSRQQHASVVRSRMSARSSRISAKPKAAPATSLPSSTISVGFQTARHISTGVTSGGSTTTPYRTVLGDFDDDGKMDVAAVVQDIDSKFWVCILLSNGDGTFQAPVMTQVTFGAGDFLAAADLNGDGKYDVVLVHSNSVDVLLGDGTGNFAAAVNYPDSIPTPAAVGLMEANGDSATDIIVVNATHDNSGQSPVAILPGLLLSVGTFGPAVIQHYDGTMDYGVVADIDGDGLPDLISATQVFLKTGVGYQPAVTLTTTPNTCGAIVGSIAVGDVTGDGRLDVVTADCLAGTVTVFANLGSGAFDSGVSTSVGYRPSTVAIANFDAGTTQDLVVGDFYSMDLMILLGNNNDGTFLTATVGFPPGGDLWTAPLVSEFRGSGHHDIVIPSGIPDQWSALVYLQDLVDGTLVAPPDYYYASGSLGSSADSYGIATADLNQDGLPDFVVGNLSDDTSVGVTVFLSNSSKTLDLGANYGSGGNLPFVALTDVDGDGNPDLIASSLEGSLQIFLGNGDGTFHASPDTIAVNSGSSLGQLAVGRFNGDTTPDIAVLDTSGNVWVLLNTSIAGTPSFATPVNYSLSSIGWEIAASDLGNGHTDLVVTQAQSSAVSILLGDGSGTFAPQTDFDLGSMYPGGLAIAQLNPSGHPDLVVTIDDSDAGMGIAVASGNGDGTFGPPILYLATTGITGTVTPEPAEVRVADLNADGNLDLVFTNAGSGTVGVLYGTGQWGVGQSPFYAPLEFGANDFPRALLLVDVNGDGALDAVIDSFNFSGVTTLLNTGADNVTISSGSSGSMVRGPKRATRSARPHDAGGSFTFTASVHPLRLPGDSSLNDPNGTVTFTDGDTELGTAALSGGEASITSDITTPGTHVITAIYSGDNHFVGQSKATFVQNIDAPVSTYLLTANPNNASLIPGQSANFTITATPNPISTDTVNFSCGTLPQGLSCSFNPASITLDADGAQSTILTVSVAPTFVASSDFHPDPNRSVPIAGTTIGVLGWFFLGGFRRTPRRKCTALLTLMALTALLTLVGCAASPANSSLSPTPTPKTIHVMATTVGTSTTQQLDLTVTIQR
jgi:hypothetical protein